MKVRSFIVAVVAAVSSPRPALPAATAAVCYDVTVNLNGDTVSASRLHLAVLRAAGEGLAGLDRPIVVPGPGRDSARGPGQPPR